MNLILFHFLSGSAYFTGCLMLIAATPLSLLYKRKIPRIVVRLFLALGLLFMLLSGTPCGAFYRFLVLICLALFVGLQAGVPALAPFTHLMRALVFVCALCSMVSESKRLRMPQMPGPYDKIFVVGDSISAGIGFKGETTWPEIVAERLGGKVAVKNLSVGGAGVASALESSSPAIGRNSLVILELGGNDILRKSSPEEFHKGLDALLKSLVKCNKSVMMFELPTPPHQSAYLDAQRRLAARYSVSLLPRMALASAIFSPDTTVDGLHLSNKGHELLASAVLSCLPLQE